MSNDDTIETLFKFAITAEKAALEFYLGLAEKFSHLPEVSDFWKGMMEDEKLHAQELEDIRGSLSPDQIAAPGDPSTVRKMRGALKFSVDDALSTVRTLDDAYNLAHELEDSEVNKVFECLTMTCIHSEERKKFVKSALEDHMLKLAEFSETFGNAKWRKCVGIKDR